MVCRIPTIRPFSPNVTHYSYVAIPAKQNGRNDFWHRVGSVFQRKNGNGFDLVIPEGISVTGRLVCREQKAEEADGAEEAAV